MVRMVAIVPVIGFSTAVVPFTCAQQAYLPFYCRCIISSDYPLLTHKSVGSLICSDLIRCNFHEIALERARKSAGCAWGWEGIVA